MGHLVELVTRLQVITLDSIAPRQSVDYRGALRPAMRSVRHCVRPDELGPVERSTLSNWRFRTRSKVQTLRRFRRKVIEALIGRFPKRLDK